MGSSLAMADAFDKLVEAIRVLDQHIREQEDRTLLVRIQFEEYLISCEVLDEVFSRFGNLESIEKFGHDSQYHSRVCFCNRDSALEAFNCFDGRFIYEDCCRLELSFVASDRSSSFEAPNQDIDKDPEDLHIQYESSMADGLKNHSKIEEFVDDSLKQNLEASRMNEQKKQRSEFIVVGEVQGWQEEIEAPVKALRQEFEFEAISKSSTAMPQVLVDGSEAVSVEIYPLEDESAEGSDEPYSAKELSKSSMALNPSECEFSNSPTTCIPFGTLRLELEIKSISRVLEFSKKLGINGYAHKVFEEMTEKEFVVFGLSAVLNHDALRVIHVVDGKWVLIFDP